ncbi:hypothetical protein [Pullulanibacillus pueri]|uniref:Uncharacterized protein n=1 Tax=Pullulanibacillus pueri TaxID=1437324 RepID=A0A8J2ZYP4_9BACL|nr:hypothetical protein [Pullulanibacillus pueri]GGH84969.1 hypothetical protein GCM10007096_29270 [Pullulanibacillus pueri]
MSNGIPKQLFNFDNRKAVLVNEQGAKGESVVLSVEGQEKGCTANSNSKSACLLFSLI